MRVIYELENHKGAQATDVSVDVHPYGGLISLPPAWNDARAEVTFMGDPHHEVAIEGKLSDLREALTRMLGMLTDIEKWHQEDLAQRIAHSTQCQICSTWWDTRRPAAWGHPDGKGRVCMGDGIVLVRAGEGDAKSLDHFDGHVTSKVIMQNYSNKNYLSLLDRPK